VVAPAAGGRWRRIVAAATHAAPHTLGKSLLYAVSPSLPPLRASGKIATAGAGATALRARVRYDGLRGHLELALGSGSAVRVSTPSGDVDETAAAVGADGRAAAVFTEWRRGSLFVEVATHDPGGRWRVVTVDRRKQPVWSPRVVIAANGTTAVTWVDETDPLRLVRAAIRTPSGRWQPTVTLDDADGLASVEMAAADHGGVLFVWHDSLANEERVRVASYSRRGWRSATTVGSAVGGLTRLRITGRPATGVEWQAHGRIEVWHRGGTT
jgi:hypothetical protein